MMPQAAPSHEILLAQSDSVQQLLEQLGSAFRAEGTTWPALVHRVLVFILVACVVVPLFLFSRGMMRRLNPTGGPNNLFRTAMRVCGIGTLDAWLLCTIARKQQLPNPTAMLMAEPLFLSLAKQSSNSFPAVLRRWASRRLAAIQIKLFHS